MESPAPAVSLYAYGPEKALVLRPNSGVSGDILAAGLLRMADFRQKDINEALRSLGLPELAGKVRSVEREVSGISGRALEIDLPKERRHRSFADITDFFSRTTVTARARELALESFRILAEAEAAVHGKPASEVHFHEVGALDSILDAGLCSILFDLLDPDVLVCGPLPVCDGTIVCAHGTLNSPAPAVLRLLEGVPVRGLDTTGETVTPTGISLLKAFGAVFGPWPDMTVDAQAICYGQRILAGVPNGALMAYGRLRQAQARQAHPTVHEHG
jgi:uncharacterized protein (DUF111 family)